MKEGRSEEKWEEGRMGRIMKGNTRREEKGGEGG